MKHSKLLVLDIETVPDTVAACRLLDIDPTSSIDYIRKKLHEYHLRITEGRNSFVRQLFHQVVAISFLEADIEYLSDGTEKYHVVDVRSGGIKESSEQDLIEGFFAFFSKLKPRIVSFNGKTFDLPTLKYRGMLYGQQATWLFKGGDKWSNYNQKYSLEWHCDLIDALSDYGSSARIKMSEICALFGIPCKLDGDGSSVQNMYDADQIEAIRDYCETDVLSTYLVYLKYQIFNGSISKKNYQLMLDQLVDLLISYDKEIFQRYLEQLEVFVEINMQAKNSVAS